MPDALTDILGSVRMKSSVFSRASLDAPWGVESGDLGGGIFHAVVRGRAHARLAGGGRGAVLERGDIVMMPHGDNHLMTDEPNRPTRLIADLTTTDENGMGHLVVEGEGPHTSLICGRVVFDGAGAHPMFSMLPPIVHVRDEDGSMSRVVASLIDLIAAEVDGHTPGSEAVVARLTGVLVVYVLRDFISRLPADEKGWLGALRDPEIGRALGLIHEAPEQSWTADDLASAVGMSRSAFFARFGDLVGETPAQYHTRWRIHLACRLLREERASVTGTARRVGYSTDAAFSNAFLRIMGVRPGAYRSTVDTDLVATSSENLRR